MLARAEVCCTRSRSGVAPLRRQSGRPSIIIIDGGPLLMVAQSASVPRVLRSRARDAGSANEARKEGAVGQVIDFGARRPPARALEFFLFFSGLLSTNKRTTTAPNLSLAGCSSAADESQIAEERTRLDWTGGDSRWARLFLSSPFGRILIRGGGARLITMRERTHSGR